MEQTILPNETDVVKVIHESGSLYSLEAYSIDGMHKVYLPTSTQPELIEHYVQKDHRDYPETWSEQEVCIYDACELTVTIVFTWWGGMGEVRGPSIVVEVEMVDITCHIDERWPA